jgi:hypothetical protein
MAKSGIENDAPVKVRRQAGGRPMVLRSPPIASGNSRREVIHCIADQVCSRSRQRASGLMHDAPGCNPGSTPTCSLVTSPKAGRWQKAGAGRLWCANKEGAPELAGFMARVRQHASCTDCRPLFDHNERSEWREFGRRAMKPVSAGESSPREGRRPHPTAQHSLPAPAFRSKITFDTHRRSGPAAAATPATSAPRPRHPVSPPSPAPPPSG